MPDTDFRFLSWVRSGLAAALAQPDTFGEAQPSVASATLGVTVGARPEPVTQAVALRGPGDVIGLSRSQVVRTDPIDGAVGVEPNYFAQIEFDRPDLPWLFTPAAPAGDRLRPWLVLVVLDTQGPGACRVEAATPLPRVRVSAAAAAALPDLRDAHLWAHAQVLTPQGQGVADALRGDPRLSVSRLLCPRHLSPQRGYVAAVVPAFEAGRLAGLGLPVTPQDESRLAPAWRPGAPVVLPVFHSWEFRTGDGADFEALAKRLQGRPLPAGVGTRALDLSRPGAGLPERPVPASVDDTASITWIGGALQAIDAAHPPRDPAEAQALAAQLTVLLDRPAVLVEGGQRDPVVAPPLYGDRHARVVRLGSGGAPPWMSELNLDPALRVAAGLGTQVVQAGQDDYMARAWRQLDEVLAANRLLRAAQLARAGSQRLHRRLAVLQPAAWLSLSQPLHARVLADTPQRSTLATALARSRLPPAAVQPALRRMTRPGTAAARASARLDLAPALVARFATEAFAPAHGELDGVVRMRPAAEVIGGVRASAVLRELGDDRPEDGLRLDTALDALAAARQPLPAGELLRSQALRNDIGSVAMVAGLGALSAPSLAAVLSAAVPPPPPPPPPTPSAPAPPAGPGRGGGVRGGGLTSPHRPGGVSIEPGRTVPTPAGPRSPGPVSLEPVRRPGGQPLGRIDRVAVGRVRIDEAVLQQVQSHAGALTRLDEPRWAELQQRQAVPRARGSADPSIDIGSRLDRFRQDPAALQALADVAAGETDGALALDRAAGGLAATGTAAQAVRRLAEGRFTALLPEFEPIAAGPDDVGTAHQMVFAAALALDRMVSVSDAVSTPAAPPLDLAAAQATLLRRTDPALTVQARVKARLHIAIPGSRAAPRDPLDAVMACPRLDDPMWKPLAALGHGWLLPGLERVPPDTVTLVRTHPAFVAAHLVGLNHEMMRELLWREYPTDQRGTAFHRFWGRMGAQPDDIGPVHGLRGPLAGNLLSGGQGEAVLLLRSELLRRYPGSLVYLCRARPAGDQLALDDDSLVAPSFRGDLPPDLSFVGFPIAPEALRDTADPWWFVIAQPPTEPRFGLDEGGGATPARPATPSDLAWSHMAEPGALAAFAVGDPAALRGVSLDGVSWGMSAAVQAHLTYQRPVRVAIRAHDLLPPA